MDRYRTSSGGPAVIPLGRAGTDVISYGWKILVGGVDVTTYVDIESIRIDNTLSERVDICDFTVYDDTGVLFFGDEQEVIITDAASNIVFGGWMNNPKFHMEGLVNVWECEAREYGIILDQRRVNRTYVDVADTLAIADPNQGLIPLYVPELSTSVTFIANIDRKQFPRQTVREALRAICNYTGGDFFVGYDKVLHYFPPGGITAPFGLSDNPDFVTTFPVFDWVFERDSTQIKNRIIVHGGEYVSSPFTEVFSGDGTTTVFTTKHPKPQPMTVTVAGVVYAVGLSAVNTYADGFAVLVDDVNKTWTFQSPPANGASIALQYQYRAPIQIQVISAASRNLYGRYYDDFINDHGLLSQQAAIDRGNADLNQFAFTRELATCKTLQPGLRSGMLINVTDAHTKTSDGSALSSHPMLIQQVTTTGLGGGYFQYELQLGNYNQDILMQIVGYAQESQRTTMTVDFLSEFATISDSTTTGDTQVATPHTGAYHWGDAAMKWGFFQWG